jgi:hypothetical protein
MKLVILPGFFGFPFCNLFAKRGSFKFGLIRARLNGANQDLSNPYEWPYKQLIISFTVIGAGSGKNADQDERAPFLFLFSDLLSKCKLPISILWTASKKTMQQSGSK